MTLKELLTEGKLTAREQTVARLVVVGMSNQEIGSQIQISEKTVKFHLTSIYKKLSVKSRAQLIVKLLPFSLSEFPVVDGDDTVATLS